MTLPERRRSRSVPVLHFSRGRTSCATSRIRAGFGSLNSSGEERPDLRGGLRPESKSLPAHTKTPFPPRHTTPFRVQCAPAGTVFSGQGCRLTSEKHRLRDIMVPKTRATTPSPGVIYSPLRYCLIVSLDLTVQHLSSLTVPEQVLEIHHSWLTCLFCTHLQQLSFSTWLLKSRKQWPSNFHNKFHPGR